MHQSLYGRSQAGEAPQRYAMAQVPNQPICYVH